LEIKLAENYGFCFGVKRAIEIAEDSQNAYTYGPLIHNKDEINRLQEKFNVTTAHEIEELENADKVIIRTHGIVKKELKKLQESGKEIINATCPFVTKPQEIVQQMSEEGYKIIIFGDEKHPEVKGVKSYAVNEPLVVMDTSDLEECYLGPKVAVVSQTTRKVKEFIKIVNYLMERVKEVRVFNTICNATFENQEAADKLSKEADVMIVIGGKNSSNTKQLFSIVQKNCSDSYHIELPEELEESWFKEKKLCGITAGASTPDWIIQNVIEKIRKFSV
jgi:4-hydroxy-3-methylbut-2-enyl diphosphate reductase